MAKVNTLVGLAAVGIIWILVASPAAGDNVLRWASDVGALTFDPHSAKHGPSTIQRDQVYERLLHTSAGLEVVPQLAIAWRPLDALTWEFELRKGVRFHDGAPFTAEDVVFSIGRARSEPSQVAGDFADISEARALDADTVHFTTRTPDALLPDRLRLLFIMSKTWAEKHGVTRAADFRAGEETYATRHANGTGPFILERFEPGGRIVTRRNPDWWGYERYPVNIDRIEFTPIAAPEQRLAALMSGEIDLLTSPPFDALDRIEATPGLKLAQTTQLRSVWLGVNQASPELRSSDLKGVNPFKDEHVRRAMYRAIDVEAIRDQVMQGRSVPAGMIIPPGVNGHAPEFDQRLPYDPEAARALLTEAGYPNGFGVTLDCPSNQYINDEAICRAAAKQLSEVGIEVSIDAQPEDRHYQKVDARHSDFWLESFTAETLDSLEVVDLFFRSGGLFNAFGYANPRVDELIDQLGMASLTYARDALIEEVWRIVLDDIVFLPLHHQVLVWAMRDNLDLPISPLNYPVFREARLKAPIN
ncbi:MAG TPA: ABC transporter substrate-binding protein [Geminicoccaceae bacterium]|jgi:peptide/nickel transport system substrate-binding protein|nr:ABC transporter substrate-binding protein [Geminicoccaceae bacterium]